MRLLAELGKIKKLWFINTMEERDEKEGYYSMSVYEPVLTIP
jgi:hypothetical protein